jgi:hypothetical protein
VTDARGRLPPLRGSGALALAYPGLTPGATGLGPVRGLRQRGRLAALCDDGRASGLSLLAVAEDDGEGAEGADAGDGDEEDGQVAAGGVTGTGGRDGEADGGEEDGGKGEFQGVEGRGIWGEEKGSKAAERGFALAYAQASCCSGFLPLLLLQV